MLSFTGKVVDIKRKLFQLDENKSYDVEIKEHREKRSLNANSYLWVLISEIASILNTDKDSVYLIMLKRYGVSEVVAVKNHVEFEKYVKYCEKIESNARYSYYKLYKGSSQYDTKEMTVLLNGVVSECREMGIPTKEDYELQKIMEFWEEEYI